MLNIELDRAAKSRTLADEMRPAIVEMVLKRRQMLRETTGALNYAGVLTSSLAQMVNREILADVPHREHAEYLAAARAAFSAEWNDDADVLNGLLASYDHARWTGRAIGFARIGTLAIGLLLLAPVLSNFLIIQAVRLCLLFSRLFRVARQLGNRYGRYVRHEVSE